MNGSIPNSHQIKIHWRRNRPRWRLLLLGFMLLTAVPFFFLETAVPLAFADAYNYESTATVAIPDTACGSSEATINFNITDDFTVDDLNIGLIIEHTFRADLEVTLQPPSGPVITLFTDVGGGGNNFDILLDSDAATNVNTIAGTPNVGDANYYEQTFTPEVANALDSADTLNSVGTWTLSVCDDAGGDIGNVLRAALQFDGTPSIMPNQIEGAVFYDADADGAKDGAEAGLENVTITAYDASGNSASTATDANGGYTILNTDGSPANLSGDVRVEFVLPTDNSLNYLEPTFAGDTTVQFADIDSGAILNAGFHEPGRHCQNNPQLALSCYTNGDPTDASNVGEVAIARAEYTDRSGTTATTKNASTNMEDVGTIWGLTFDSNSSSFYMASVLKRHSGVGPEGLGAIYLQTDFTDPSTLQGTPFYDFADAVVGPDVPTNAVRFSTGANVDGTRTGDNIDPDVFGFIAKRGLGGIDISDDGSTLYAMNLYDRQLYSINVASTNGTNDATAIANAPWLDNSICGSPATGVARPWAVTYYREQVYVGVVCDASMTLTCGPTGQCADLTGHVYAHDGNSWSTVFSPIDLSYERFFYQAGAAGTAYWHPWSDSYGDSSTFDMRPYVDLEEELATDAHVDVQYPQPILGDIEFDDDGSIMVGLLDRSSMQFGYQAPAPDATDGGDIDVRYFSAGDVLRIGYTSDGSAYALENDGQTYDADGNLLTSADTTSPSGPGGQEFYDDRWQGTNPANATSDGVVGGLTFKPGSGELLYATSDAFAYYGAGYRFVSNSDGSDNGGIQVYTDDSVVTGGTPAKAGGLGDVVLFCEAAPIEIGNRVWEDTDGDGIQDPGEAVMVGVIVTLHDMDNGGAQVGSATTDANGNFLFGGMADTNMSSGSLLFNRNYEIRISLADGNLTATMVTVQNANSVSDNNNQTDLSDSDAVSSGGNAVIAFTTGVGGENNHTLDFGFTSVTATTDFGDLPDTFDTTTAESGPNHTINSNLYLGSCIDGEMDGLPSARAGTDGAGGDDSSAGTGLQGSCSVVGDDEDGITLITPLIAGNEACVSVTAINGTGSAANLYGFIDFDGDGQFDGDTDEPLDGGTNGVTFSSGIASVANGGVSGAAYCFDVPAGATFDGGETHLRFRLTSDTLAGNLWAGAASDGEVEDYYTPLACVGNYLWIDSGATANQQDGTDVAVTDGTAVNLIWGGADGVIGTGGDDITYSSTTTGGSYSFCGLPVDANGDSSADEYRVVVPSSPGTPVTANQGGDDALDSDGMGNGNASEGPTFTVAIPNTVTDNAGNDNDPNSYPDDQTDLTFDFGFASTYSDFGDLPDSFDTTNANSGPSHIISANLYLGGCVDGEGNGDPDNEAGVDLFGGDDSSVGGGTQGSCTVAGDDEDGGTFVTPFIPGNEACILVTAVNGTGSAANLYGFIDYNGDGDFDGDADEPLNGGTNGTTFSGGVASVPNGGVTNATYCFDVPAGASFDGGETHLRFRLTSDTLAGNLWAGAASDGEVEDYFLPMTCAGNFVFADVGATAGTQDGTDTGLNGITVNLVWGGLDANLGTAGDNVTYTTSTANSGVDGKYQFCGLIPGTYRVDVPTAPGSFGFATAPNNGNDDVDDSDGLQPTGYNGAVSGPAFTIATPSFGGGNYYGLPTGEGSTGDTPGSINGFPDSSDDLTFDFGFVNSAAQDWGDLPDSYGTTAGNNGAAHTVTGLYMGDCVDTEPTGYPDPNATNEDGSATAPAGTTGTCTTGNDDEDGVTPTGNWSDGTAELTVVSNGAGCMNVWVDFTDGVSAGSDGDFDDVLSAIDEHVIENQPVTAGSNALTFALPASVADSASFGVRARLTAEDGGGGCGGAEAYGGTAVSTNSASSGEVEDYIFSFNPTAIGLANLGAGTSLTVSILLSTLFLLVGLGVTLLVVKRRKGLFG